MQALKNILLVGAVVFMPAAAFASDLAPTPVEPVPPVVEPTFTWTGFYAGANAGWASGSLKTDLAAIPAVALQPLAQALVVLPEGRGRLKETTDGFTAGGQIGYNYQFDPHWVVGAEADLQYADIRSTAHALGVGGVPISVKTQLDWFGTARLRAGYAFDNFLLYGTGGFAYGNVKSKVSVPGQSVSGSDTRFGWTLGAGAEYALTQHWILRAEYLYVDLGKDTTINKNAGIYRITDKPDVSLNIVRAAVNYKF